MFDATQTIHRMFGTCGVQTDDKGLTRVLGLPDGTIAAWRRSGRIPIEFIVDFAVSYDVSLDWLILGKITEREDRPLTYAEATRTTFPLKLGDKTRRQLAAALGSLARDLLIDAPPAGTLSQDMVEQIRRDLA